MSTSEKMSKMRRKADDIWSEGDRQIIKDHYADKTNKELREMLDSDRTLQAIVMQAQELGIKKNKEARSRATTHKDYRLLHMTEAEAAQWLHHRHWDENKPLKQIAEEDIDLDRKNLTRWFDDLGVPYRSISEDNKRRYSEMTQKEINAQTNAANKSMRKKMQNENWKTEQMEKVLSAQRHETTKIEQELALELDDMEIEYIKQKNIGSWQVDFYLSDRRLVIEADGVYWHGLDEVKKRDKRKNTWLRKHGYEVLRLDGDTIRNGDVKPKINSAMQYAVI